MDSVVRFEGENTLLQLVRCIYSESDWTDIKGIAFRNNGKIVVNPLPPLENDIDRFPFPLRSPLTEYAFGKRSAPILAGRGCVYNCSFCNIRKYYQESSGPPKRIRKPEMVVNEMESLFLEKKCSVFIFQDDDFPVKTANGSEWIKTFCKELINRKLNRKVMWKINCRPDEIEYESFSLMKANGLFLVFLGIEEGTNSGLKNLNKHMTIERSLEGINDLKKLGIGFDFGFMLFNPQSTFSTINENLEFLKQVFSDGYTPVTFLKMLPYFETDVENKLKKEGRLKGKLGFLNYSFLDESLNYYYDFFEEGFLEWLRDPNGLLNMLKWARNYLSVYSFFFGQTEEFRIISLKVKKVIAESNNFLIDIMKDLLYYFGQEKYGNKNHARFAMAYSKKIKDRHDFFREEINSYMAELFNIYKKRRSIHLIEKSF